MPIYEYECQKCNLKFELSKKVGDQVEVYCPKCRGQARRIFSSIPSFFRGTRWVGERKQKQDSQPEKKTESKTEESKKTDKTDKAS